MQANAPHSRVKCKVLIQNLVSARLIQIFRFFTTIRQVTNKKEKPKILVFFIFVNNVCCHRFRECPTTKNYPSVVLCIKLTY